jgi:hypothetical protein
MLQNLWNGLRARGGVGWHGHEVVPAIAPETLSKFTIGLEDSVNCQ